MDKFDIFKGCKCLYTPMGAAREYAPVGCNFYRGCPYQCKYCYNRKGITSGIMGVDHAVLESCFVIRPKKFRDMSAESYALMCFVNEVDAHLDYLRDMGVFFSFSTDPWLPETRDLTWKCATFAALKGIPVKILTKCAVITDEVRLYASSLLKQFVSFGFTLTGRDDQESNASTNQERVAVMRELHEMGYKTFASIEPIVDFESSYKMIRRTVGFCDQYLIGLMSKRGKDFPPYETADCVKFIQNVVRLLQRQDSRCSVYWKESILNFVGYRDVRGSLAVKNALKKCSAFTVNRNYCIHRGTVVYPIHTLANTIFPQAVAHLEALKQDDGHRKRHEIALISFYRMFREVNDFIEYSDFLSGGDMDNLYETAKSIYVESIRFVNAYRSQMDDNEYLKEPFSIRVGKADFPTPLLYVLGIYMKRIASAIMVDIDNIRKERK